MLALELLAERKIEDAVSRGELENLPGAGRPLALDDDPLVPEELRLAYRILKNAGFVPLEVQQLNEIRQLEDLVLRGTLDAQANSRAVRKLALLRTHIESRYYEQAVSRLAR
ncbi:MAG TPA: DnaJ family domain-containing protein [Burkholderiales bacterium]|nr:DnaJ family domain-containing protein [Burkholderiales bacterium]